MGIVVMMIGNLHLIESSKSQLLVKSGGQVQVALEYVVEVVPDVDRVWIQSGSPQG